MSTSGVYTWSSSRDVICSEALRKIGALGDFEVTPSSSDQRMVNAISAINPMIKTFQGFGMPVWAISLTTLSLGGWTTNPQSIGPGMTFNQTDKPLKIVQALRQDVSTSQEVPLLIDPFENYENLVNKVATGAPVRLFYQPLAYSGNIYIWPLPDSSWLSNNLIIRYQRPFQDFNASADEPDFPKEWHEALIYQLAVRLAPVYGLPPADRDRLERTADKILSVALSFDQEEGSVYFQPRYY